MRMRNFHSALGMNTSVHEAIYGRLGPELITVAADRDFSAGQSNWIISAGTEITWSASAMHFVATEFNATFLTIGSLNIGIIRVEFEITSYTSGWLAIYPAGEPKILFQPLTTKVYELYISCGNQDFIGFGTTDGIYSIDNVSVKNILF